MIKNLLQFVDQFNNDNICREHLAKSRWGNSPTCPHCGATNSYVTNRGYKCSDKDCKMKFSALTGTIFENTKVPLRKWFIAIYISTAHKKGISSLQLSRDINVTQKTAWFMLHRIRKMMGNSKNILSGIVEVDETYVGGKTINKHKWERDQRQKMGTGQVHMTGLVAMAQRGGSVITKVIDKAIPSIVEPIITGSVDNSAVVYTDGHGAYSKLHLKMTHESVNHTAGEFKRGNIHTNTVEGFFSQMKRGINGIYHFVSKKHLGTYANEFAYRHNTRESSDIDRFTSVFSQVNCRLTYNNLVYGKQ